MKKNLLLSISFLFLSTIAFGQNYLFNKIDKVSGFGGPILEFSTLNSEAALSVGGGGGLLLNNHFFFGGYGMGLTTDVSFITGNEQFALDMGHGGFWLGGIISPSNMVHIGVSSKLGWGSATLGNNNGLDIEDGIFVFSPQLELEVNMTPWLKTNLGGGYRLVSGFKNEFLEEDSLSAPTLTLSFIFGWFK